MTDIANDECVRSQQGWTWGKDGAICYNILLIVSLILQTWHLT